MLLLRSSSVGSSTKEIIRPSQYLGEVRLDLTRQLRLCKHTLRYEMLALAHPGDRSPSSCTDHSLQTICFEQPASSHMHQYRTARGSIPLLTRHTVAPSLSDTVLAFSHIAQRPLINLPLKRMYLFVSISALATLAIVSKLWHA